MIDLEKEVIFRDGWTLDNGVNDLTEKILGNAGYVCELGQKYGLSLDKFEIDAEMIYFEWRGSKRNVLDFFTYYAKNMADETEEEIEATRKIILSK